MQLAVSRKGEMNSYHGGNVNMYVGQSQNIQRLRIYLPVRYLAYDEAQRTGQCSAWQHKAG